MTKIEILGTGCAKCKRLYANVQEAVKDLKITADVIKVEDLDEIVERGVMLTPGLFHITLIPQRVKLFTWRLKKKKDHGAFLKMIRDRGFKRVLQRAVVRAIPGPCQIPGGVQPSPFPCG